MVNAVDVTLADVSQYQDLVRQMDLDSAKVSKPLDHKKIIAEVGCPFLEVVTVVVAVVVVG